MSTQPPAEKNSDAVWPALVTVRAAAAGQKASFKAVLMNRKAFRKSRETGIPWIVHPETGRLLPWPENPALLSLKEGAGCFIMEIDPAPEPYGRGAPPQTNPDSRKAMKSFSETPSGARSAPEAPAPSSLHALARLIARRRREMPEGSYTTHLFREGPDKIRKKTGEEAVELLLAQTPQDMVYESADLIYHLLVLLEASNLSWNNVVEELERRHTTSA